MKWMEYLLISFKVAVTIAILLTWNNVRDFHRVNRLEICDWIVYLLILTIVLVIFLWI